MCESVVASMVTWPEGIGGSESMSDKTDSSSGGIDSDSACSLDKSSVLETRGGGADDSSGTT